MKHKVTILIAVCLFLTACNGSITGNFVSEEKVSLIGISQWIDGEDFDQNVKGFKEGLAANGYREGENVEFFLGVASANHRKQEKIVHNFLENEVDLIYSLTTSGTLVVKNIVKDTPVVFSIVTYPSEAKITEHGNFVGTRNYVSVLRQSKIFEEIFPGFRSIGFVHRQGEVNSDIQLREFTDFFAKKNIKVVPIAVDSLEELREQIAIHSVDVFYSACDSLIQSGGEEIVIEHSLDVKKPVFSCNKAGVVKGALAGNVADLEEIGFISGEKAALILDGAEPSWISTEKPRREHVFINKKTAQKLTIEIPAEVSRRAHVIE